MLIMLPQVQMTSNQRVGVGLDSVPNRIGLEWDWGRITTHYQASEDWGSLHLILVWSNIWKQIIN